MANLALCARTAHQGGFVGNTGKFRHPKGKWSGRHSFGYFSVAADKKVTRPRCENRNVSATKVANTLRTKTSSTNKSTIP